MFICSGCSYNRFDIPLKCIQPFMAMYYISKLIYVVFHSLTCIIRYAYQLHPSISRIPQRKYVFTPSGKLISILNPDRGRCKQEGPTVPINRSVVRLFYFSAYYVENVPGCWAFIFSTAGILCGNTRELPPVMLGIKWKRSNALNIQECGNGWHG